MSNVGLMDDPRKPILSQQTAIHRYWSKKPQAQLKSTSQALKPPPPPRQVAELIHHLEDEVPHVHLATLNVVDGLHLRPGPGTPTQNVAVDGPRSGWKKNKRPTWKTEFSGDRAAPKLPG